MIAEYLLRIPNLSTNVVMFADEASGGFAAAEAATFVGATQRQWENVAYLAAAALLIACLKGLSHPRWAVLGNLVGALGLFLAVAATLAELYGSDMPILLGVVVAGMAFGAVVGAVLAIRVPATAISGRVALLNGFGGLASMLVAGAALVEESATGFAPTRQFSIAVIAAGILGAATFGGSVATWARFASRKTFHKPASFRGLQTVNLLLAAGSLALGAALACAVERDDPGRYAWVVVPMCAAATLFGVGTMIPIRDADVPVAASMFTSYSGLAVAATGLAIDNNVLIVGGALVAGSAMALCRSTCKAMNRSLSDVLLGAINVDGRGGTPD